MSNPHDFTPACHLRVFAAQMRDDAKANALFAETATGYWLAQHLKAAKKCAKQAERFEQAARQLEQLEAA
jgi:hypothetical protein